MLLVTSASAFARVSAPRGERWYLAQARRVESRRRISRHSPAQYLMTSIALEQTQTSPWQRPQRNARTSFDHTEPGDNFLDTAAAIERCSPPEHRVGHRDDPEGSGGCPGPSRLVSRAHSATRSRCRAPANRGSHARPQPSDLGTDDLGEVATLGSRWRRSRVGLRAAIARSAGRSLNSEFPAVRPSRERCIPPRHVA